MEKRIYLSTPTTHGEEMNYIKEAFDKNWVAPLGFNCDNFESEICEYLGRFDNENRFALSLVSGTASIHLAVKLAGIQEGDIVLCSDMTFSATVNPISYENGKQVFVDCERESWNISPDALEKAFEKYPNAKAVVVVHLYGVPCNMDRIVEICKKHNAILIEDAAEALSATYKGKPCGTFGDYGIFSFNGNKIITTSGGGMLITKTQKDRDKAFFWATQSRENAPWYQHEEIGYNYRMSNIVAGVGRGQLPHLDEHHELKKKIYKKYDEGLSGLPITMNPHLPDSEPNYWLSCMLINEDVKVTPTEIIEKLAKENIECRHIWKPMHAQPVFKDCDFISASEASVGMDIFNRGVCLPSDIKMTDEEQQRVIEIIKSCF